MALVACRVDIGTLLPQIANSWEYGGAATAARQELMGLNNELNGLLVVSIEQAVAAPYCGLLLADAGARVVKVERPDGDFARGYDKGAGGESAFFAWLNRGKESVCLNFAEGQDMAVLRTMLRKADIFLHNLAPGALERRGLGGPELRQNNPGLITCELTGYGREGSGANKKAYDFLVQGETGLCSVTGSEIAPARVGISISDLSTGQTAFSAILRALIQRGKTGEGIDLSLSMFDVVADWMNMPLLAHRYLGGAPKRSGLTHGFIAPYGAFPTGDGGQVLISIQSNREFRTFCDAILQQPALADDPRFANNTDRIANEPTLANIITTSFARTTRDELLTALHDAGIASGALNDVAQLSDHDCLRNVSVKFEGTDVRMADLPVKIDGDRHMIAPALDEHGAAIRSEFAS